MSQVICYNFKFLPDSDFCISADNRAFAYGDGLFETIITDTNGKPRFWGAHWQRLSEGMNMLQLIASQEFISESVLKIAQELAVINFPQQQVRLRLRVWRKSGGLYTPTNNGIEWLLETSLHIPAPSEKKNAVIAQTVKLQFSAWSRFKTCNSLPYVMAGIERNNRQADEIVLTNTQDYLAECQASNLFWIKENILFTPSLATGCIDGVARKQLLYLAEQNGMTTQEGLFYPDILQSSKVVFSANVTGITIVRNVENMKFSVTNNVFSFLDYTQKLIQ